MNQRGDFDDPCPTCGYALVDLCGECHRPLGSGRGHEECAMTAEEFIARLRDPNAWSDPECPEAR